MLPAEVRVVAETHPLFGRLLQAASIKRLEGVWRLVVDLPDSSPGTIAAKATDVFGEGHLERTQPAVAFTRGGPMSASATVGVEPLVWPPATGGDRRQVSRMLHGLAVELAAIHDALVLAERLREELASGQVELLVQRLGAIDSVAVTIGQDSTHLVTILEAEAPQAGLNLRGASERRREILAAVRG